MGWFLGGLDGFLYALLMFVVIDYATGLMAAFVQKKVSSEVGFKGICKKVAIFCLVGIGHVLDTQVIQNGSVLRTAVIFFYLSNEGISIIENVALIGLPVPKKLKEVLEQLHEEADEKRRMSNMAVKVCLDAGHYGKYNRSPAVSSYYESDMTWKLHNYLKKELESFGIVVVTTRTNQNTDRALYERGAASKGCNLFISVHSNAVGNGVNENVDYPVAYVLLNGSSTDIGLKLAKVVEAVMGTAQSGRTATRQGTNGEYYGVLRGANAVGTPGIILEHSFHTNTRATKWLSIDSNLQKLAKAEAECIASYYGVKKKGENTFTEIMGNAVATMEQMTAYIKAKNPDVAQSVIDMIPLYLSEGKAEGVRGDIAFAQSCLETGNFGFFGSAVTLDQNNFCGMGVTSNGMRGNSFDTPQLGIRAQVQHLKAYASTVDLKNECVDPRFKYVTRGCAEYVEWLGQKENPDGRGWAAGAGYGAKIITILNTMIGIKNETTEPEEVWYRVRKTWTDAATQKGAFHSLENAKRCADENEGYSVFDESGKVIYSNDTFTPYLVRVSIEDLNIRRGPGTDYDKTGKYTGKGAFTIVEEAEGKGASLWGLLKSYQKNRDGWISLDYTERV